MSVWFILRHFNMRIGWKRIVKATRHTKRNGCYTIALALALHEFGLDVEFHTDPDQDIQPLEDRCYEWAKKRGVVIEPALDLNELRLAVKHSPAIVYLAGSNGEGHCSPLIGFYRGNALLPYVEDGKLPLDIFEQRWSGPGYPRQTILIES